MDIRPQYYSAQYEFELATIAMCNTKHSDVVGFNHAVRRWVVACNDFDNEIDILVDAAISVNTGSK